MAIESVRARAAALMIVVSVSAASLVAQTVVKPPKNRYTPKQDVQLGKEAAAEIREQYPLIEEPQIARYLARLGERLVAAAPASLKEPVYEYSFTPVNLKEINAFALPGGPMFVNRGMFDAAGSEGEVVGVMAHELSHVLLRHGTANMSKARNPWLQLGQIAGVVGGAVVGGAAGSVISQGSQFGLGTLLLRYSRDYEKQADLLGAQTMARAGYDPRALARMFETIERESSSSGGSGPQWMSSHPNPGNRTQYITREAEGLAIANAADQNEFAPAKAAFASLPPAKSMQDLEQSKRGSRGGEPASR
jgi:predicted Zn-dependent protease